MQNSEAARSETTRSHVEAMAGLGISAADIARVLGVDVAVLQQHYARELSAAPVKATAKVAENLFRKATGDGREAVTAAIFWLKTRSGWRETNVHEVSGPAGGPIETVEVSTTDLARALLSVLAR